MFIECRFYIQMTMDIAFIREKNKFMVVYLDDIIIFLQSDDKHMQHLSQNFKKCRIYVISFNPKKYIFSLKKR